MFRFIIVSLVSISFVVLFLSACTDPGINATPGEQRRQTRSFVLWGDYTNRAGTNPIFQYLPDSSDVANVTFAAIETSEAQGFVTIKIKNLSLADTAGNYVLESNDVIDDPIVVEEKREGRVWISDVEFGHDFKALTQIAVVLALDISSSLGSDFSSLKQFAKEFLQIVEKNISGPQIGLVVFSDKIETMALTTDIKTIERFIDGLVQGANSTKLYDAMMQGIVMLNNVTVDGKALVTFTDGVDNFSTVSSSAVIDSLKASEIKSFTIGLGKNNLDTQILAELAVNGISKTAESLSVLQSVFQRFSREITNVYNVTYTRNAQLIQDAMPIRFIFKGSINLE